MRGLNPSVAVSRHSELSAGRMPGQQAVDMRLTCDDQRVGDGGLAEHALHVAGEELESLAASALRVHQDHDPAGPTHLHVHGTWDGQRGEREPENKRTPAHA